MVRPGDRGARTQQDQRVEQRQRERIHHRLDPLGRELPADHFGKLAGEQGEIEPAPEPADEEHHFRRDEQDHAVAQVKLHNRRMEALAAFLDDVVEPAEERGDQARDAEPQHQVPAAHLVHEQHHARSEGQRPTQRRRRARYRAEGCGSRGSWRRPWIASWLGRSRMRFEGPLMPRRAGPEPRRGVISACGRCSSR